MRRVVITGMGIVSSIGNNTEEVLASLREAKSGIGHSASYAEHGFRSQVEGRPSLDAESVVDRRAMRFHGGGTAWNHVASVADAVEHMALGTATGPTRLGPFSTAMAADSTMARVEGPPEPMIIPVRSFETSPASRPAFRIAWSMATWFQAVPPPWKRMARRSTIPSGSRSGLPET